MKILLVHNFYGSAAPSGENKVFESEKKMLEMRGHDVAVFTRHSDEIRTQGLWGSIKGAASVPWNIFSSASIVKAVDEFRPDVVHVHNTFPLISPSIFHAIGYRAATVLTLHNYRLLCPAAIPMRHGKVCIDCIDHQSVMPALQYGCYRSSRLATLPLAANVALHRAIGTWQHKVDAFVALTSFQRDVVVKGGLPLQKVFVKANYFSGNPVVIPFNQRIKRVVFVGRLSEEKGVHTLIKAWELWGSEAPELLIVGDGPMRLELQQRAQGLPVRFVGQVDASEANSYIASAWLLVLPSEWFEGFGMVLCEAFAHGTPVAASDIGPLSSIVIAGNNGVLFEAANAESLLNSVRYAWCTEGLLERLARGARHSFDTLYNEDANYQLLMKIYNEAISRNRSSSL